MKVDILRVRIDQIRFSEAVERITSLVRDGGRHYVVTANPEMIIEAQHNQAFLDVINKADLVVPDGVGLQAMAEYRANSKEQRAKSIYKKPFAIRYMQFASWIGCWIGVPLKMKRARVLPERVSGADLVLVLTEYAAAHNIQLVLIGGAPGQAAGARQALLTRYPSVQIQALAGPAAVEYESVSEFNDLRSQIPLNGPAFIFVAFGHPKQELWIAKHLSELPAGVAIGVGGTFAYLSGAKRRSPVLFQRIGLEWLWRLVIEPKRIKRILDATIVFPSKVYSQGVRDKEN